MQLKSKIKEVFSDELLKLFASVCDTRRIDSAHKKMKLIQQLLKKYEIPYQPLGGATNRIALMINGYTFKFALDRQGYKDNLMEYALSEELQPYVTKTYETSGYIIVAECIRMMTLEEWHLRAGDIKKVLEMLAQDYLLGDVGYIKKNFTNWGVRDDGSVVILDYAYCHRATENLFTCEVCGSGVLRYDSTYTFLKCSNATVCTAKYEYTERKLIQGDEVDWGMIDEVKEESIIIPKGKKSVEVTDNDGILVDGNIKIINTLDEYYEYLRRNQKMGINFDEEKVLSLTIEQMKTKDPKRKAEIEKELDVLVSVEPDDEDVTERVDMDAINLELYGEEEEQEGYNNEDYDVCDADYAEDFSSLVKQVSKASHKTNVPVQVPDEEEDVEGVEVQFSEPKLKPHANVLIEEDETEELEGVSVVGGKVQKEEKKECHCRKDVTVDEAIRVLTAEGYSVSSPEHDTDDCDDAEEETPIMTFDEVVKLMEPLGFKLITPEISAAVIDRCPNTETFDEAFRQILEYYDKMQEQDKQLQNALIGTVTKEEFKDAFISMGTNPEIEELPTVPKEIKEKEEKLSMKHYDPEEKVYREAINPNDDKVGEVTGNEADEEVVEQSADTDVDYKGITLNGEPVGVE